MGDLGISDVAEGAGNVNLAGFCPVVEAEHRRRGKEDVALLLKGVVGILADKYRLLWHWQ